MADEQSVDSFLESLGARPGPGQSGFTLDPEKAREKLGLLGSQIAGYYFLKLVQFATSSGASALHLDTCDTWAETRFSGLPQLTGERVVELYDNPGLVRSTSEGYLIPQSLRDRGTRLDFGNRRREEALLD